MQTTIATSLSNDARAIAASDELKKCVHCGFCLATCPTYNLLGDEKDSPRGRIYLVKQVIEGHEPSTVTRDHLDRCLTCRNCETTCPSGVEYSRLIDAGRSLVEERVPRTLKEKLMRRAVLASIPYAKRIGSLVKLGQLFRPVLPNALAQSIPPRQDVPWLPRNKTHARKMLVLDGCAQPSMSPATNVSATRVLSAFGIDLQSASSAGCCGAVHFHLNEQEAAKDFMRRNIDAWWPFVESGCESIITTASGCGVMVKDYGHVLEGDPEYADKAKRISELSCDLVEALSQVLNKEELSRYTKAAAGMGKVAYHPPCTLQHGQKLPLSVEGILGKIGVQLLDVPDSHSCCGSAGTYSLFQPEISRQLRTKKVSALLSNQPDILATANIGCQLHIQTGSGRTVLHWIELIDKIITESGVSES